MLLFFDVDGTLIAEDHRIPASVRPALEAARSRGHRVLINTGRTLCNLDHRLDELPVDGWILGCGSRVIFQGETLKALEYAHEPSLRLRTLFLRLRIPLVYECDTAMYFDPLSPSHPTLEAFRDYALRTGIFREITENDEEFRAVKMFCFTEQEDDLQRIRVETAALGMPFSAIDRRPEGWELVPAGVSKGTGMDLLREKLGIGKEDCMAFGDSLNDEAMFRHAGISVAMGNATENVKALCSYVTARPEEDGIQKALRHFRLI